MTQNARNALLEAEGHLNLEIQLALKEFRGKLLELEHEEKLYPKDAGININGV